MSYGITQYDIEKAIRDEKNTKYIESDFSVFSKEMLVKMRYSNMSVKQKVSVTTKLWQEKRMKESKSLKEKREKEYRLYNEFKTTMWIELKRDYINKYGLENYMIEKECIDDNMLETINNKYQMLLMWQTTS